jgi:two-component system CheB/CheR fusion protein
MPTAGRPLVSPGKRESLAGVVVDALRHTLGQTIRKSQGHEHIEIARLDAELGNSHRHLLAMVEEHEHAREDLRASEEELLSSNKEFQSTNEELETAKEELHSANEELTTTNDELRYRNQELGLASEDVARARDFSQAIGIITLKIDTIDLVETVRRVIEAMRTEFEACQHEVTVSFLLGILPIAADAMRIEQIVTNLLGNAIKYTRPGGHIRIVVERRFDDAC